MSKWRLFNTGCKRWERFFEDRSFFLLPTVVWRYNWFGTHSFYVCWLFWLLAWTKDGWKNPEPETQQEEAT